MTITILGYALFILALIFALYFRSESVKWRNALQRERRFKISASSAIAGIVVLSILLLRRSE